MTLNRFGGIFGLFGAILLVAGMTISGDSPAGNAPDQEWIDYIHSDQSALILRAYLLGASGLSFVAFYALGVRPRLGESPTDRALAGLGAGAAQLMAAALTVGGLVGAAVGAAHVFADISPDPTLARLLDNLLYGAVLVGSSVPAAVVMAVVAVQSFRRAAFARWVGWLSLFAIVGMAGSLIFIPFVLLPIWQIAISISVLRSRPATDAEVMTLGLAGATG